MSGDEYGYLPLSRKMVDGHDVLWEAPEPFDCRSAWIDLLYLARFAPGVSEGEELQRGEFLASVRFLATRWKWGRGTVHDFLRTLEKHGRIAERKTGRRGTVYVVVNYAQYNPTNGRPRTPKRTPDRTMTGQQPDKDKERERKDPSDLDALVQEGRKAWKTEMGGDLNFGRLKRVYRGLLTEGHTPDAIRAHWGELFRRATDKQFVSPEAWASKFGVYAPTGQASVPGTEPTEARYQYLASEARRGMDMERYSDWSQYRPRYQGREVTHGAL
jgi:hypothetical protein